jgi:hypothetical protein
VEGSLLDGPSALEEGPAGGSVGAGSVALSGVFAVAVAGATLLALLVASVTAGDRLSEPQLNSRHTDTLAPASGARRRHRRACIAL